MTERSLMVENTAAEGEDYPAAHSMDTTWFAVDAQGHIGMFSSGEAGAVPVGALRDEEASEEVYSLLTDEILEKPRTDALLDPRGLVLPAHAERYDLVGKPGPRFARNNVLIYIKDPQSLSAEILRGQAVEIPSNTRGVFLVSQLTTQRLWELSAGSQYVLLQNSFYHPHMRADCGVYVYEHLTENWISGPYGRVGVPAKPLHIRELPEVVQNALESFVWKGVAFDSSVHVQPAGDVPVVSWGHNFMHIDGTVAPLDIEE